MIKKSMLQLMRRGVMAALVAAVTLTAGAIPAKPGLVRTLQLADGTTVTAHLVGDEFGHYWQTADGKHYVAVDGQYQEETPAIRAISLIFIKSPR